MCGIVGYVGNREAQTILVDGLRKLEYRGYDSAGLAVLGEHGLEIRRAKGKLSNLDPLLAQQPLHGRVGIGHTRWATHGRPSDENAHPHRFGGVAMVHNGIVENHLALREELKAAGPTSSPWRPTLRSSRTWWSRRSGDLRAHLRPILLG